MTKEQLRKFSETVITIGVNLQKGQTLVVSCPIHAKETAHELAKVAYEHGASRVIMDYKDNEFMRMRYENESVDSLTNIYEYEVLQRNHLVDIDACRVAIYSEDPEVFAGIDAEKMGAYDKALGTLIKPYQDHQMSNGMRWCVVCVPEEKWAKKIFPELSGEEAQEKLWDMIQKTMMLDHEDPIKAWKDKCETMNRRAKFLNDNNFQYFHYTNSLGTDLMVEMMPDSIFMAADEKAKDGTNFIANLPTEEIFSAPHKLGANGVLYSALPLCYNGNVIDKFMLEFKDGRIVNYKAEQGEDILKSIIDTDEGSHYLGEIAMVQHDSPISNLKTLFYNTLFDENASCHFAIGQGYPSCCAAGETLKGDELVEHGLNYSLTHEDFMVGTADLKIEGITTEGRVIVIMEDGNFVI